MRSHNDSTCRASRTSLFAGLATCSMIICLLFTSSLYAQTPNDPTSLTATTVNQSSINLTWSHTADAVTDSFIVRRATTTGGPYTIIGGTAVGTTTFSDIGLSANTQYFYVVFAKDVDAPASSSNSNEANATTAPAVPAFSSVTTVNQAQIDLSWASVTGATEYIIWRNGALYDSTASTSYQNTGLSANTAYSYQIRSKSSNGRSDVSSPAVSATTAPAVPTGLTATTMNQAQINLSWASVPGATSYIIWRNGALYDSTASTSYQNTGLSANTAYSYQIRSKSSNGRSDVSSPAVSATTAPAVPTGLTATTISNTQINLSWASVTGATSYIIWRNGALYDSTALTSYQNTGLSASTLYSYQIRSKSSNGRSDVSSPAVSATTNPNAPAAPSNLDAIATSASQIDLSWVDNSNGASQEDKFKIERKTGAGGTYAQIDSVSADVTTYPNTGLNENTMYYYRVRASNVTGNSAYSNEDSAKTVFKAPTGLTATAFSNTQINLAWTDSSGIEEGYKIERSSVSNTGPFTQIIILSPNTQAYSNTGLVTNTQYYYRVRAYKGTDNSDYSNVASATTNPDPPAAPSSLTATAVSNNQIDLTWADNSSNETGFKIERKLTSGVTYSEITTVAAGATSYSDNTGLAASTSYTYRVYAINAGGNSAFSNTVSATTLVDPPAAPDNLAAVPAGLGGVDLEWDDNSSNEDGFKIERRLTSDPPAAFAQIAQVAANDTNYSDTGLANNTSYTYRVRAFRGTPNSHSAYSNEDDAQTNDGPPAAPDSLTATAVSNTQINLEWDDNSNNETGFQVEIGLSASGPFNLIGSNSANDTTFQVAGLEGDTPYFFRVNAFNGGGSSGYSNVASATTLPDPPAAPSNLTAAVVSFTQIDLAWTDNANNELGFIIERKLNTVGASFAPIDTVGSSATGYSDMNVSVNTAYIYRVRSYNSLANSAYSNEASAATSLPAAPSALTATLQNNVEVNLTWTDNANNEAGFVIEMKIGSGGTFAELASVGANISGYLVQALNQNTEYSFQVRAYNQVGNSAYSNIFTVTTLPDPPAAPSNLTATATSSSQINLSWTDNSSNEAGFKIERRLTSGVTFAEIATVGPNTTTYSDSDPNLTPNTSYTYRVRAHNGAGHSPYSNTASATTFPNSPATPTSLTATPVSYTQINLVWIDNSTDEQGFKIERKLTSAPVDSFVQIGTNVADDVTFSDMGPLTPSTSYDYRVRAFNTGGLNNSGYSTPASATTTPGPPNAPSNLRAMAFNNTQIDLEWHDNSSDETSFKIELATSSGGSYTEIGTNIANDTTFSVTGLTPSTIYFFRVRASNGNGNSGYSNVASDTTLPDLPVAPGSLAATPVSHTQIDLIWADNSSNESGFKIERKLTSGTTFTQIALVGPNVTSYSSTGLSASTSYTYRVRAYNVTGHSGYSNTASATTLVSPPAAPSALTATAASISQINLAWTDNASNEDGFKVERKGPSDADYAEIASLGANAMSYSNTGLIANTIYSYRVRAFRTGAANSYSGYSNVASDTTLADPPAAPSALAATAMSTTQIDLSWADNSSNEDGFKIERKTGVNGTYAQIATVGAGITIYSNTGLGVNTRYFYRVRAYNASGNSGYSNEADKFTLMNGPSNLAATAISSSQINLTWAEAVVNETGFEVQRKIGAGGTYATIGTAAKNATSHSDVGLSANTIYFYRVRAVSATNVSAYTNEASDTTQASVPTAPAAPTNLTAAAVGNSQINLAWTDHASNEDGFKIESSATSGGPFTEIAAVGANVTSYSNTGLGANTQYFYRVRAFNAVGNSAYSNEADALTLMNPPTNLAATGVSNNQVNLTWSESVINETGFEVQRKTGAGGAYATIATAAQNATSYSDVGLSANTTYFYRVRSVNATNVSDYTNEANATTLTSPPLTPLPPENLMATPVSKSQIDLSWVDKSSNEDGFKIERKTGVNGTYAQIASVGAGVTTFSNTGLGAGTRYYYRVRAYNANGNSAYSGEANALTLMNGPANLAATAVSSSQINLTWTESLANETGFEIERKTGAGGTYATVATVAQNATSYSDPGLNASTEYFYRVRAISAANVSGYTNEASATTQASIPAAPEGLAATATSTTQINLSWVDKSNNEDGFKIERKAGVSGTYAEIASVGAGVTTFSNAGLAVNARYFYRVRAFNAIGHSGYSNEANSYTFMNGPTNLVATAVSSSQINLTWAESVFNETGFEIERKIGVGGTYAKIVTVGQNVTSYSNSGLSANTQYFYRVRAISATNVSAYTNEANATTSIAKSAGEMASGVIPEGISLAPNYPNPFNPSTTISFSLPEGMHVSLEVVNVTGQVVATLVNGYRNSGIHRVTFKAGNLPSGVYYAVLKAGEVTQVQRMTLAK